MSSLSLEDFRTESACYATLKVTFSIPYVILREMTAKGLYATLNGL